MRQIYNFFVYLGVLWVANHFFGDLVVADSLKTLLLAVVFMFVLSWLYQIAFVLSALLMTVGVGCFTTPVLLVVAIFLTPLELWLASTYIPGFHVNGFWAYLAITVVLGIFTLKPKTETKEEK